MLPTIVQETWTAGVVTALVVFTRLMAEGAMDGCRLLQGALGGAGETAVIICCSPGIRSAQETLSTLRFGARAQGIVNTVQVLL